MRYFIIALLFSFGVRNSFPQGTTPTFQVKTMADLIATPIPTINNRLTAIVSGRVSTNDGAGGVFIYDSASSTTTNLGTVLKPSGSTGRWLKQVGSELRVSEFGALDDSVTDNTTAIQNAITTAVSMGIRSVVFDGGGTFMVNAVTGIQLTNNLAILIRPDTTIQAIATSNGSYGILWAQNVTNIYVGGGGKVVGDRVAHTGVTGQQGMGVRIEGCRDFTVENLTISDCWGDGVYIGYNVTTPQNLRGTVKNVRSINNRRNAMSIVTGKGILVEDCHFLNSNGSSPEGGLDIEPDPTDVTYAEDIIVQGCFASGNIGTGFDTATVYVRNIKFIGNISSNNGIYGFRSHSSAGNILFTGNTSSSNVLSGFLVVGNQAGLPQNFTLTDNVANTNGNHGIFLSDYITGATVSGNKVRENMRHGIVLSNNVDQVTLSHNYAEANSQLADNTYDNFHVTAASHGISLIGNIARQGALGNDPRYGIFCDSYEGIWISGNELIDGGQTAPISAISTLQAHEWYDRTNLTYRVANNTPTMTLSATNAFLKQLNVSGTSTFTNQVNLDGSSANIALGSNWLSGDGGDEGISVDSNGNVNIGISGIAVPFYVVEDDASNSSVTDIGFLVHTTSGVPAAGIGSALSFNAENTSGVNRGLAKISGIATDAGANTDGKLVFGTFDNTNNTDWWEISTAGNFVGLVAGKGLQLKEGSNARMGATALVNGTVTVSNTSVTATTRIFLTRGVRAGTTVGILGVGTVIASTSFVIESVDLAGALSADDDSTVNWLLVEPSP